MNFWTVKNVQKYYNCINPSLSTVKKFYAMLHLKYYGSTTLTHSQMTKFYPCPNEKLFQAINSNVTQNIKIILHLQIFCFFYDIFQKACVFFFFFCSRRGQKSSLCGKGLTLYHSTNFRQVQIQSIHRRQNKYD